MFATLAVSALIIEAAFGTPQSLVRRIGHPVTWIGALLEGCEKRWNDPSLSFALRRRNGSAAMATALVAAGAVATALTFAATATLPAAIAALVIAAAASTLIAQRSLDAHVRAVADALETGGLDAGRAAVSHIVGRDPNALDEAGVSRAAIESLAENFSDGVVGPLLWLVVGGLPGAAVYKAINTADSMIGHKSDRYHAFGWAAARLDDVVNLPASRLAACWIAAAAAVLPTASAWGALRAVSRDARHHRSPNAGWPEAAMAGALGLRLAGPRTYDGVLVDDHWMGDGRVEACAADIRAALTLYRVACVLQGAAVAALAAFMSWS